jgi:hypothetical protein
MAGSGASDLNLNDRYDLGPSRPEAEEEEEVQRGKDDGPDPPVP